MKIPEYISKHVHNPASTLTNLAYILLGYLALSRNPVLGFMMIGLGVASTGFHWTRENAWHKADMVAIYYIFGVIGSWWFMGDFGVLIGLVLGGIGHWSFTSYSRYGQHVIGGLGLYSLIGYWVHNSFNEAVFVLMWFAIAMIFGRLAVYLNPREDSVEYDAFHAWWHIFSAIGIYYLII